MKKASSRKTKQVNIEVVYYLNEFAQNLIWVVARVQVSYRGVDETLTSSQQKVVIVFGTDKLVSPWQEAERPVNTANSREGRDLGFGTLH